MSDEAHRPEDVTPDSRAVIDIRIDTPGREGLTGTAVANLYKPVEDSEQVTIAPDWRPMDQQPVWRRDFPIDWVYRRPGLPVAILSGNADPPPVNVPPGVPVLLKPFGTAELAARLRLLA